MAIDGPISDLSRSIQHEPDTTWPYSVKVQLLWMVNHQPHVRSIVIEADQFFGLGRYGAPLDGNALIGMIENMRKEGPPPVERKIRGTKKKR
jgi:hypothetical protein